MKIDRKTTGRVTALAVAVFSVAVLFPSHGQAASKKFSFDNVRGKGEMYWVKVKNRSAADVDGVRVTQQEGGGCSRYTIRNNAKLQGKVGTAGASNSFFVQIYGKCTYKVRFSVAANCKGDKDIFIRPSDKKVDTEGMDNLNVVLNGDCGVNGVNTVKNNKSRGWGDPTADADES